MEEENATGEGDLAQASRPKAGATLRKMLKSGDGTCKKAKGNTFEGGEVKQRKTLTIIEK